MPTVSCEVIPFPTSRRVGKIRRTAQVLSEKTGKGADHYWRQVIEGMRSQMRAAALSDEVIDRELEDFASHVFSTVRQVG
ncbi:protein of unknown function [Aminobacter niigataensis]|nr:protein of unknown function [Aminobacter niigataensis]